MWIFRHATIVAEFLKRSISKEFQVMCHNDASLSLASLLWLFYFSLRFVHDEEDEELEVAGLLWCNMAVFFFCFVFCPQVVFQTAWRTVWIRSFSHRPPTGQAWTLPSTQSSTEPTGTVIDLMPHQLNLQKGSSVVGGTAESQFGRCRKGCEWFGGWWFVCVRSSMLLHIRF